jgi:TPR repeat protein
LIALGGTPPSEEIVPPPATSAPPPAPAASSGTSRQASKADIQSAWRQIEESVDAGDYADFAAAFPGTNDALQALRRARQVSAWSELDKSQPAPVDEFLKSGIFPALQVKVRRFLEAEAPSNAGLAALLTKYQDEEREAQRQAEEAARVLEERKRGDEALRTKQQAAADALKRKYRRRWAAVVVPLVMAGAGTGIYFAYDAYQKALVAQGQAAYDKADYSEAIRLYRLAADQGHAVAQYSLGNIYYLGKRGPPSYSAAVRLYRLAADQGLAEAQYMLGEMYRYGRGVPQDNFEAIRWYRLAANQGYAPAQYTLSNLCRALAEACR